MMGNGSRSGCGVSCGDSFVSRNVSESLESVEVVLIVLRLGFELSISALLAGSHGHAPAADEHHGELTRFMKAQGVSSLQVWLLWMFQVVIQGWRLVGESA
jgi:hypothetical protein